MWQSMGQLSEQSLLSILTAYVTLRSKALRALTHVPGDQGLTPVRVARYMLQQHSLDARPKFGRYFDLIYAVARQSSISFPLGTVVCDAATFI